MCARRPRPLSRAFAAVAGVLWACAPAPAPETPSPIHSGAALPAPWSAPAVGASAIPAVYLEAWRVAENRSRCALLAPELLDPVLQRTAHPRTATFSGGWAVAYDLPESRSAFGVAGTGTKAWGPGIYDGWPHKRVFADGSRVGYGPEGGTGPNWLAYLRIPGQECLYNVWSRRGQSHLEELLGQLRLVAA